MQVKAPRGTYDLLPGQIERWQWLIAQAREVFTQYGYGEIITPIFEHAELIERGVGETTDIVSKQMYTFSDKSGRRLTLRPEWTAPVVRAYLEHNLHARPQPVKLYYIGPSFRYERPQAGRYRQFHQLGAEAIGSADPALDAEMIAMPIELYRRLGLSRFVILLNSIGCPVCRPAYRQALRAALAPHLEELCPVCRTRYDLNPLRILDCKSEKCHELSAGVPASREFLCRECADHFAQVQAILEAFGLEYRLDDRLVRGLDYYTKTVFEVTSPDLGSQSSLLGGGRYDGLVEECGGPPTPGVGFAAGMERAMSVMEEQGLNPPVKGGPDVFVVTAGGSRAGEYGVRLRGLALLNELRRAGLTAETDYMNRSLKAQLKAAGRLSSRFALIIGSEEMAKNTVQIKDMQQGTQEELPLDGDLIGWIQQRIGGSKQ